MLARETIFSSCRMWRYSLWRSWDMFNPSFLQVIGLNPSIANEHEDDPTIRRCIDFAKRFGFGGLCMTNLFGLVSTQPAGLRLAADPIGPGNDAMLVAVAQEAGMILAAWGTPGVYQGRDRQVMQLLALGACKPFMCLGTTKDGMPRHPLYLPKTVGPHIYPCA